MIATWLGVAGVRIAVHSDPLNGWHPMVIGAPAPAGTNRLPMRSPSICGGSTNSMSDFHIGRLRRPRRCNFQGRSRVPDVRAPSVNEDARSAVLRDAGV